MDLKLLAYYHHRSTAVGIIKLNAHFLYILLSAMSDCISFGLVEPCLVSFLIVSVQNRSLDTGWSCTRAGSSSPDS